MKSIFLPPSSAHFFTAIGNSDAHKIFPIPSPSFCSFSLLVTITFHSSFRLLTPLFHFTLFYWPSQNLYPILQMSLIKLLFKSRSYLIPSSGKTNNPHFYLKFHPWSWMKLWEEKSFGAKSLFLLILFLLLTQKLLSVSCSGFYQLILGKL